MSKYYTIEDMISMIDGLNQSACLKLLNDNIKLFKVVSGSTNNHQAWYGGYYDHIQEVMNIAILLYPTLHNLRALPFSLSDSLLILFLHDIEKPWKYELREDGQLYHVPALQTKEQQHEFREHKLKEYNIVLTEAQKNALKYVEGEKDEYSNRHRVMGPLAAFCHMADVTSARIWFEYPLQSE